MIDTDKYEGHTPANLWGKTIVAEGKNKIFLNTAWLSSIGNDVYSNEKDRLLMADAPKLLAEVKRLRERLIRAYDWAENAVNGNDSAMMDYTEYVCGGEEE